MLERRAVDARARAGARSASPSARSPPSSVQRASSRSWLASARVIASRSARERRVGEAGASAACSSASSSASSGRAASTVAQRRRARRRRPSAAGRRARGPGGGSRSPASACSRPARMRSSVDLPPPLGPSTPIREPAGDLEVGAVEDRAPAEGLREPARGQQGYGRHRPLASASRGYAAIEPAAPDGRDATPSSTSAPSRTRPPRCAPSRTAAGASRARGGRRPRLGRRARTSPSCPPPCAGSSCRRRRGAWMDARPGARRTISSPRAGGAYALAGRRARAGLLLAGVRGSRLRADQDLGPARRRALEGSTVAIIGAGGIGRALIGDARAARRRGDRRHAQRPRRPGRGAHAAGRADRRGLGHGATTS